MLTFFGAIQVCTTSGQLDGRLNSVDSIQAPERHMLYLYQATRGALPSSRSPTFKAAPWRMPPCFLNLLRRAWPRCAARWATAIDPHHIGEGRGHSPPNGLPEGA